MTGEQGTEDSSVSRQVFVPSNILTNTFVFDTVSFLSILTLMVFIVRVFSRVVRSNTVQTVEVGGDPSLGRELELLERSSEGRWGEEEEEEDSDSDLRHLLRTHIRLDSDRFSLDRRKRETGRQLQGIGGVDYDTIYLAIGVAATLLFIIETLYKAYQLYVSSGGGRQLGGSEEFISSPDIL